MAEVGLGKRPSARLLSRVSRLRDRWVGHPSMGPIVASHALGIADWCMQACAPVASADTVLALSVVDDLDLELARKLQRFVASDVEIILGMHNGAMPQEA